MGKFINLTNQKFGRLLVIDYFGKDNRGNSLWNALCDCGNTKIINGKQLRNGDTKSCGCLQKETTSFMHHKDLMGLKFDRLVVVRIFKKDNHNTYWLCKCDCQNESIVTTYNLISGTTKSCGCYNKERTQMSLSKGIIAAQNNKFAQTRNSAYRRKLSFELNKEQFINIVSMNCFYCGCKPSQITKTKTSIFIHNGIDRVDSLLGYTLSNVVSCCKKCNLAKHVMSQQEFLSWIERVYKHSIENKEK